MAVRALPPQCTLQPAPKDGNCLFHAVGAGLRWLKSQPNAFHHSDLRARVADHLDRHKADYEPTWAADGRPGPDGTPVAEWSDFITSIAVPGKFSGEVELKALCRLFSVRVVVFPSDPAWPVCAYGRAKHKDVIAVFFKDKHFDFLLPAEAYAKEITSVTTDPFGQFLVGGVSEACSASVSSCAQGAGMSAARTTSAGPQPSKRSRCGMSQACTATVTSHEPPASRKSRVRMAPAAAPAAAAQGISKRTAVSSRGPNTLSRPGRGMSVARTTYADSHIPRGGGMSAARSCTKASAAQLAKSPASIAMPPCPEHARGVKRKTGRPRLVQWSKAGFARCHLCSFMIPCHGNEEFNVQGRLRAHYARFHAGATPSGFRKGPMPTTVTSLSPDQETVWQCKFCDQGISLEASLSAGPARLARDRRRHRNDAHPHISWKAWRKAGYADRAHAATCTRYAQAEKRVAARMPPGNWTLFRWPCSNRAKGEPPWRFKLAWFCRDCGSPFYVLKEACKHASACPSVFGRSRAAERIAKLDKLERRFMAQAPKGPRRVQQLAYFRKARELFECARCMSPCF